MSPPLKPEQKPPQKPKTQVIRHGIAARDLERLEAEQDKDQRTATQVDRDRLLYSTCFARLAEVTQVVSADHGYVFHNRLTHSLKVAQLARRIAEKLLSDKEQRETIAQSGGLDADAAEAAGLAHDLGHPPFGHIAEEELDLAIKQIDPTDGYEGNAQSFRLVTRLATGDPVAEKSKGSAPLGPGLNLTRVTLNGILKYPWVINGNSSKPNKWGAYKSEEEIFRTVRDMFGSKYGAQVKSLEAEVMDWADDITYAVHDVVDFYCAGAIPLERLGERNEHTLSSFFDELFERDKNEALKARRAHLEGVFERICTDVFEAIETRYGGSREQRLSLWQLMTALIGKYVDALSIGKSEDGKHLVTISKTAEDEIAMLKQLTWHYVILNTELATLQHGHRHIVKSVFETLFNASAADGNEKWRKKLFPLFYEELISEAAGDRSMRIRIVADYVSSMTESEIVTVHRKLFGARPGPAL